MTDYPERPLWADLGGSVLDLPQLDPEPGWRTFNPSPGVSPTGELALTLRSSNYDLDQDTGELYTGGAPIRSRGWCARLTPDLQLVEPRQIRWDPAGPPVVRGTEDPKIYWRDGWRFTAVMQEPAHTPRARVVEYRLDVDTGDATWVRGWPGPSPSRPEKNWMLPYEPSPYFDWVYDARSVLADGQVVVRRDDDDPRGLRGNTNLWRLPDGEYLAAVHRLYVAQTGPVRARTGRLLQGLRKDYRHQLALFDARGRLVELSPELSFTRPGVEFAAGLCVHGGDLVVGVGVGDATAHLATIPLDRALSLLRPA